MKAAVDAAEKVGARGARPGPGLRDDPGVGRWRLVVAELTYRQAVARGIGQEMERDSTVVMLGEDIGAAGGVFKTTEGLLARFGPERVRDTPISEQAIIGAAMGAAMTGLRPVAELMFSDFFGVAWDMVANQIAKTRYMTDGQVSLPLVIRTANGGGLRFGAQHSQSIENWAMAIPGLKVVAPSTPADMVGLMAAAIRDPDPVIVCEHKALFADKADVPDGELVEPLGTARIVREGTDATVVALAAMVPRAIAAAETLAGEGISLEVIDLRSLVPLDVTTVLGSIEKTQHLFTVEENPRLCGWGAEVVSIVAEEAIYSLDGPVVRITTPHVPARREPGARGRADAVGRADRRDGPPHPRGSAMTTVAVVGTGRMGSAMARALARGGAEIVLYNRTPDAAQQLADGDRRTRRRVGGRQRRPRADVGDHDARQRRGGAKPLGRAADGLLAGAHAAACSWT